jgi:hypothetical protein
MTGGRATARKPPPPSPQPPPRFWQQLSLLAGLLIVLALLPVYLLGLKRDPTVTLAFLGVATTLIGLPAGWQLVKRNGQ